MKKLLVPVAIFAAILGQHPVCAKEIKVLDIAYYPEVVCDQTTNSPASCGAGTVDLGVITNFGGVNVNGLVEAKAKHEEFNASVINALQEGSRYQNQGAPYVTYSIVNSIVHTTLIPAAGYNGDQLVNPQAIGLKGKRPDYIKILNDANICDWVDNQGVREVWMWGYHNENIVSGGKAMPPIVPQESDMSMGSIARNSGLWNAYPGSQEINKFQPVVGGSFGDVSNAYPKGEDNLPHCQNTYTLYNYTWMSGAGNPIHNQLHQIENLMQFGYLDKNKNGIFESQTDIHNYEIFWKMFAGKQHLNANKNSRYFDPEFSYLEPTLGTQLNWICGNTHYASYSTDPSGANEYEGHNGKYNLKYGIQYNSTKFKDLDFNSTSICEQWNQPQTASPKLIDCGFWCDQYRNAETNRFFSSDISFYIWWMQKLPGATPLSLDYKGTAYQLRNWWDAKVDFDTFYSQSLSLLNDSTGSSSSSVSNSSSSSLSSSSSSVAVELGVVKMTALANGGMQFSVRLNERKQQVHLFTRRNGEQDYVVIDLQTQAGAEIDSGDGTYTYQITRSGAYVAGNLVEARFYTFTPTSGQVFYPGPVENSWTSMTYLGSSSASSQSSSLLSSSRSSSSSSDATNGYTANAVMPNGANVAYTTTANYSNGGVKITFTTTENLNWAWVFTPGWNNMARVQGNSFEVTIPNVSPGTALNYYFTVSTATRGEANNNNQPHIWVVQ